MIHRFSLRIFDITAMLTYMSLLVKRSDILGCLFFGHLDAVRVCFRIDFVIYRSIRLPITITNFKLILSYH